MPPAAKKATARKPAAASAEPPAEHDTGEKRGPSTGLASDNVGDNALMRPLVAQTSSPLAVGVDGVGPG